MGERLRGRREKDGVERTHREARSHDLMNELAWLLAAVVGRHSHHAHLASRPSSFILRSPRGVRVESRHGGRNESRSTDRTRTGQSERGEKIVGQRDDYNRGFV